MIKDHKTVELHWIEGYKLDVDSDGIIEKSWNKKYTYVRQSSTKRYYNCLYLLCRISPCGRTLMDFLSENMTDDNMVNTKQADTIRFITFISKITNGEVTFKEVTVKKAYKELRDKNLLIPIQKSRYKVNPLYFFNGSDAKRLETIKLTIKLGTGLSENDFKWVSDDVILDSRLKRHKAVAGKGIVLEREINL